jgi:predicted DNA repair protein MutK
MASGIFAILDDVATLLDDAAAMSKVAAKKTAGLLGDDLAVNAEKATGFHASRELPVIWAITKGSFLNKVIILPVAFLLSAFVPWLIVPILLIGGAYLCYEGAEKVYEWFVKHEIKEVAAKETGDPKEILQREAVKIKGAIRTDFILSIEIIIVTLGTVIDSSLTIQILVVTLIALLATVGVYSLVALLVRMDDAGRHLIAVSSSMEEGFGARSMRTGGGLLVAALPKVIRVLGVIGTLAMLLVGGGMFVHNIDALHHLLEALPALLGELIIGLAVGALLLGVLQLIKAVRPAVAE